MLTQILEVGWPSCLIEICQGWEPWYPESRKTFLYLIWNCHLPEVLGGYATECHYLQKLQISSPPLFPFPSEGAAASEMSGSAVMGNVRESEMGFSFSSVLDPWVVEKSASVSHLPPNLRKQLLFGYHFKNGKLKFCAIQPFSHLAAKRKHGTMQIAFWTGFNLFHYICSKIRNNNFLGRAPSVFCS